MTGRRLYVLERTPLRALPRIRPQPRPGDVICTLRAGQDATSREAPRLQLDGFAWVDGATLLDHQTAVELVGLANEFLRSWYRCDGTDLTVSRGVSFGELVTAALARSLNPSLALRTGEIVRRLCLAYPSAGEILSDLRDGETVEGGRSARCPVAQAVKATAESLGRAYRPIDAVDPLPPALCNNGDARLGAMFKAWLGGWRPIYLAARTRLGRRKTNPRKRIYAFTGNGLSSVLRNLAQDPDVELVLDHPSIPGALPLRGDHFFPFPDWPALLRIPALLSNLRSLSSQQWLSFQGVSYGALLAGQALRCLRDFLPHYLIYLAQARRLAERAAWDILLFNDEVMGLPRAWARLAEYRGTSMVMVRHGINQFRLLSEGIGHDLPALICLISGTDHADEFGVHLVPEAQPKKIFLGTPVIEDMDCIRGKRSPVFDRRLLILNFASMPWFDIGRQRACDSYVRDVFGLASRLAVEGWKIRYRTHPGSGLDYEERLLAEMGLHPGCIEWNRGGTFAEALAACDVVVCNLTTSLYQSLYAGWPAILYEPTYDGTAPETWPKPYFTGLASAKDVERPLARDPETLRSLVLGVMDPGSLVSRFPQLFVTSLASRFVGPEPGRAGILIADFLRAYSVARRRPPYHFDIFGQADQACP